MPGGKWLAGCSAVAVLAGASAARADLVISTGATQNVSCVSGVCTATAQDAVMNASDLTAMLAGGDVAVKTGGGALNIASEAPLSWTSASRLTLDAMQSIQIDQPMAVAGTGAMTIVTNDGGTGGDLLFGEKGSATFWDFSSSLVINGNSYTLVGDIATLAADIAANPSGFYALANAIEAKHLTFHPVPVPTEFQGTFEGLGQTILHLKIRHDKKNFEGFFAISDVPFATSILSKPVLNRPPFRIPLVLWSG